MLYLSRFVHPGQAGVVDTDDGVETVLPITQLLTLMRVNKVNVDGVSYIRTTGGRLGALLFDDLDMRAVARGYGVVQSKVKTLHGVDVAIYNGVIVGLYWSNTKTRDTRLVLSSLGLPIGDYVLQGLNRVTDPSVTLVLDDALDFGVASFTSVGLARALTDNGSRKEEAPCVGAMLISFDRQKKGSLCYFDITQLSDEKASMIYYSVYKNPNTFEYVDEYVIDRPGRLQSWIKEHIRRG